MSVDGTSPEAELAFVRDVVARARAAGADQAQARIARNETVEIDFDSRHVAMLRTTHDDDTLLTIFRGTRKGTASITGRAAAALASGLAEALAMAEAAPPDPANGLAETEPGPATEHGPAEADREHLIDAALAHIDEMARELPEIVSRNAYHCFNRTRRSYVNSAGLTRQETRGRYSFRTLFAARRDGRVTSFNYHGASSYAPFARLAAVGALPQLYRETVRSFDARPAPGKFVGDIIIAPDALGEVVIGPLARVLGGYSLMSGTSPFKDRLGQQIASPQFSLLNRPTPARFPEGIDFDAFGIPTSDLDVVRDGVLRDFMVDHYVSRKLAMKRTAVWQCYEVPPGRRSVDEMIAATERGIILTRFSGGVPNDSLDFSGVAKNAFYIEGGTVRHPLAETMISGNLRDLLMAIRDVSRETIDFGGACYPTIAASGVTISGR